MVIPDPHIWDEDSMSLKLHRYGKFKGDGRWKIAAAVNAPFSKVMNYVYFKTRVRRFQRLCYWSGTRISGCQLAKRMKEHGSAFKC